ncbi:uncharacterized protein IUM83_08082 [Phytophthora cinnamomi]|uniref:uncharacterized protein n=1 Tax=Phytophthora cinnamomi TaxID=4785 RepID=UPI00355A195D|nr:hypothetical protein IUM83_08082 [Phytophthora cinnamomi]
MVQTNESLAATVCTTESGVGKTSMVLKNVGVVDDAHEKLAEDANGDKMMADDASMEKDTAKPVPVTRSRTAKACVVATSANAPEFTRTMGTEASVETAPATMNEAAVNVPNGDVATDGGATSEASTESSDNAYERVEVEQARIVRREARQHMKRERA